VGMFGHDLGLRSGLPFGLLTLLVDASADGGVARQELDRA
jgi:hypothetical protein